MAKVKVLLDTNFLLTMVRHKIHGLEEIKSKIPVEFYTLSRVLIELKGLSKSDKKVKKEVALVEQVLKNNAVKVIDSTCENVDDELLAMSSEYIIATNDKLLRQRVNKNGGKTIYIRSLTYIDATEVVGE
jgi:rRNA-processing protein FCF1